MVGRPKSFLGGHSNVDQGFIRGAGGALNIISTHPWKESPDLFHKSIHPSMNNEALADGQGYPLW